MRPSVCADVQWPDMASWLRSRSWHRQPHALTSLDTQRLAHARKVPWRPLPPEEGVVRQEGWGAYTAFATSGRAVQALGSELVAGLNIALLDEDPVVPPFNEVTWTKYPAQRGHISRHRDPDTYIGVICIVTLLGKAPFRIWNEDDDKMSEWLTEPGDIAVLAAADWPHAGSRCPRHEVGTPDAGPRMILTYRTNGRGAGAGYDV